MKSSALYESNIQLSKISPKGNRQEMKNFNPIINNKKNYFPEEQLKNEIELNRKSCLGFIDYFGYYYLNLNHNYIENLSDLLGISFFQKIQYNSKIASFYKDQKNAISFYK